MKKINKKSKYALLTFVFLTILCPILYNIIGISVDKNGILDEPFYLIVFMYIFIFMSLISLFVYVITKIKLIRKNSVK